LVTEVRDDNPVYTYYKHAMSCANYSSDLYMYFFTGSWLYPNIFTVHVTLQYVNIDIRYTRPYEDHSCNKHKTCQVYNMNKAQLYCEQNNNLSVYV